MLITYLGHAGFCLETDDTIIIMDPWLSPTGAFDSAWFQLPRNHHMAAFVQDKLADTHKSRFVYVSHEHQDHFDMSFLNSLSNRDFTLLVPHFNRAELLSRLASYDCAKLLGFRHKDKIDLRSGYIRFYVDDSELNRDSAILVRTNGESFFNMNDCKLFDLIAEIVEE